MKSSGAIDRYTPGEIIVFYLILRIYNRNIINFYIEKTIDYDTQFSVFNEGLNATYCPSEYYSHLMCVRLQAVYLRRSAVVDQVGCPLYPGFFA